MAGHEAGVIGIAGESKRGKQIHQGSKALESEDLLSVNRRVSPLQRGRTLILEALVDVRRVAWPNWTVVWVCNSRQWFSDGLILGTILVEPEAPSIDPFSAAPTDHSTTRTSLK